MNMGNKFQSLPKLVFKINCRCCITKNEEQNEEQNDDGEDLERPISPRRIQWRDEVEQGEWEECETSAPLASESVSVQSEQTNETEISDKTL
jgi:hypothetical protein